MTTQGGPTPSGLPVLPARNVVPGRYRGVSVTRIDVPLEEDALREYFLGREAYRRTRFVVARRGEETALLSVAKASTDDLFSPITEVELIAGPQETRYVVSPGTDTAIPSALARAAAELAPGVRAVAIEGLYQHVSFIVDPDPLRVMVREVVPPRPAKLLDQAQRVLDVTDTLPPMELVADLVDIEELAAGTGADEVLLPCRGSGGQVPGASVHYLDERPERRDWTLVGCERSRQIHRWFYGENPPYVDLCPLSRDGYEAATLTKCCLQEETLREGPSWVSVPWGSSLDHVKEALFLIAGKQEPAWSPA